jgi:hypothetical protein
MPRLRHLIHAARATVFLAALATAAHAELAWTSQTFNGSLPPGQQSLTARFEFKNKGKDPVRVTEIITSCGCTNGRVDRPLYKPGQSGVLHVDFAAQGSTGPVEQTLFVTTDEPGREPYQVTLKIDIATWLSLTPRLLNWPLNSPATAQSARLTLDPAAGARLLRATSSDQAFSVQLVPGTGPDAAITRIEITPASTAQPARAIINLTVRLADATEITRTIHVRVR